MHYARVILPPYLHLRMMSKQKNGPTNICSCGVMTLKCKINFHRNGLKGIKFKTLIILQQRGKYPLPHEYPNP